MNQKKIRKIEMPGLAEYLQEIKPSEVTTTQINSLLDSTEIATLKESAAILIDLKIKMRCQENKSN